MTHQEILNKTKAEIDSLCARAKEKLEAIPPREAEVGKWYKDPNSQYLVHVTNILAKHNYVEVYGFDCKGNWFDKWDTVVHQLCTEAASQEVEKALIEEAKRLGFKGGFIFDERTNILWNQKDNGEETAVLSNGQWATIIEQEEEWVKEKEAHSNGKVIQIYSPKFDEWGDVEGENLWLPLRLYRIKPEEKPKVGDWVQLSSSNIRKVLTVYEADKWREMKPLTPKQVQELLFGKDPS